MAKTMIKKAFINSVKNDLPLKQRLAEANNCTVATIARWLREEDPMLTTILNLSIIKSHFGLLEATEILEPIEVEKE